MPTATNVQPQTRRKPRPLSWKSAKSAVCKLGMVLRRTESGEYRVNFLGEPLRLAYFTSDLADAVKTAEIMAVNRAARPRAIID